MIQFLEDVVKQRDKIYSDERNLLSLPIKIQFMEEEVNHYGILKQRNNSYRK